MKKISSILIGVCAIFALVSCEDKPKSDTIIVEKPIIVKSKKVEKMGDYSQNRTINWAGSEYNIVLNFAADPSLPVVKEGSYKYYDNRITLKVLRADGSEFFNRSLTKADFKVYVSKNIAENGALVGMVYDHADANNVYFTVSVGSPDKTSDEYVALQFKLSRMGEVSISQLNPLISDDE